ncbi:MAG: putative S-adenosylmethionine-dependent methyltransferase [Candidatus Peregrinibacteria bacterium GW2011_GWA2_47_7]|nr:MAG: putative S-adenosylmethionine-dependent methyltransferase [Candidatus Peregrinibacteria bacterium GW2011_GWA2_47_7]
MKASSLLKKVKADYSAIAEEFDETRKAPWPEFEDLWNRALRRTSERPISLLDVGCGNGRLLNFLPKDAVEYHGVDNSRALLTFAKKHHPKAKFRYADALKLPFPPGIYSNRVIKNLLIALLTNRSSLGEKINRFSATTTPSPISS